MTDSHIDPERAQFDAFKDLPPIPTITRWRVRG